MSRRHRIYDFLDGKCPAFLLCNSGPADKFFELRVENSEIRHYKRAGAFTNPEGLGHDSTLLVELQNEAPAELFEGALIAF